MCRLLRYFCLAELGLVFPCPACAGRGQLAISKHTGSITAAERSRGQAQPPAADSSKTVRSTASFRVEYSAAVASPTSSSRLMAVMTLWQSRVPAGGDFGGT